MARYRLAPVGGGVFDTDTNTWITPDVNSRRWNDYLVWAQTNTADPAPTPDLATYKAAKIVDVRAAAEVKREPYVSVLRGENFVRLATYDEGIRCVADIVGNQDAAHYPLLAALIPETDATVALVAAAVNTERLTRMGNLKAIEDVLSTAVAAVNAAANAAAVDAVVAAIVWP